MALTKLLFIVTDSRLGGTERTIINLLRNLDKKKYTPYLAVLKGGGELAEEYRSVCEQYIDLGMRSVTDIFKIKKLLCFIDDNAIGYVHSFLFHSNVVARIIKFFRKHIVCINAHRTMEYGKSWHLIIDRMTKKLSDFEIANAQAVREFYIRYTHSNPETFITIYNGIDPYALDAAYSSVAHADVSEKEGLSFGCIGSFTKAKGQIVLLDALREVVKEYPGIRLSFVGDGPLRNMCEDYASVAGLSSNVEFIEKTMDIKQSYGKFRCLIIPSLWEGMPNVLLEALYLGKSVIASDVGGVVEIAQKTRGVLLVRPKDSHELAQKIGEYCADQMLFDAYAEESHHLIGHDFSIKRMISEYEAFYDTIINSRK